MSFSEIITELLGGSRLNFTYLWGILCATFGEKNGPGQVRSRIYDVIRGIASGRLLKEIVFSAKELAAIDWYGDIMHGLGQHMTTCEL